MSVGPLPLNPSSRVPLAAAEESVDNVVDVLERLGNGGRGLLVIGSMELSGIGGMGVPERLGINGRGLLGISGLMSLYALEVDVQEPDCSSVGLACVGLKEPSCFGVGLEEPEDCFEESKIFQEPDGFEEKSICFVFVLEEPDCFAGTSLTFLFLLFPEKTGIWICPTSGNQRQSTSSSWHCIQSPNARTFQT